MSCRRAWSAQCNKPEIKLNVREVEWKSLMNECLMRTEIFKNCENESEEESLSLNPNAAMDLRHKMVKDSGKVLCVPQLQTHTEALKLLRINNFNRMLRQKEGKIVEKEIARLKETLENNRSLVQKTVNETTNKKTKPSPHTLKFVKYFAKQWKTLESHNSVCETGTWLTHSTQMTVETTINRQEIPFDVQETSEMLDEVEESLEPVPTLEGSITTDEVEFVEEISVVDEGKSEIMRRFFEKSIQFVNKEMNDLKRCERVEKIKEIQNKIKLRIIHHAWMIWKVYTQECKNRRIGRKIYKSKIEQFLSKLKEREKREDAGNIKSKNEVKIICKLEGIVKNRENQSLQEKERHLKKLMEEVKISRMEAYQKLRDLSKTNLRIKEKDPTLKSIMKFEERRAERLKRWKEIQERKLKLEEERKNALKQKEDEKKRKEEENRRKKLKEAKERRRLEMEKRKEQEQEREKLRVNMSLAENHYRKYLLRSYGLRPWLTLLKIRDQQEQQAQSFYELKLMRNAFNSLQSNAQQRMALKINRAIEFHERMLKKNFLLLWLEFHAETIRRNQVAVDWNEFKITERAFKRWLQFTQNEQLEYLNKKEMAVLIYERNLKMKYLKKLRDYPEFKMQEQAKENRKRKWRQRVKEILPDYQPVNISRDC